MTHDLSFADYRSKVLGCWLGKNVGGTFGAPFEGDKRINDLTFYRPVPTEPLPNDDLDLQLMWLLLLEEIGGREPTLGDLARTWRRLMVKYPWDEYGIAMMNMEAGLEPPIAGVFRNGYVDNMGAAIRSEIWACLAPADPDRAALMAFRDATIDHAGGEGVYGAMFWAALQSAAFVESDVQTLLRIGLGVIPLHSLLARAIREAIFLHGKGFAFEAARDKMAGLFSNTVVNDHSWTDETTLWGGVNHGCYAPINHGITVLGWLYGDGFGDQLCTAVNCGYDTDCTAATLGATLGIIGGEDAIDQKWLDPIGTAIVIHQYSKPLDGAPLSIEELTERTIALAQRAGTIPESVDRAQLWRNEKALAAIRDLDTLSGQVETPQGTIILHYGGEPVLHAGQSRWVRVSVLGDKTVESVELSTDANWTIEREGASWRITSESDEAATIRADVRFSDSTQSGADFVWVAPKDAPWGVEINVPTNSQTKERIAGFAPSDGK